MTPEPVRYAIIGGAGFIGSHLAGVLLADPGVREVRVLDNLSSGSRAHLAPLAGDPRFAVTVGDVRDIPATAELLRGADVVVHLASNPDIARGATEPAVDFDDGTLLTHSVVEAMRIAGVRRILYASGSGVYGDLGHREVAEDHGPLYPVSAYGASKLAGEAMISAYAHLLGWQARVFRFANVVGPGQTHGVGFDFVRRLRADPTRLTVFGDGSQSKSYIHVHDVLGAVLLAARAPVGTIAAYNVTTPDFLSVREIVGLALAAVGLRPEDVAVEYGTEPAGWPGDVPVVRLSSAPITALGWSCRMSSAEAMRAALAAMVEELDAVGAPAAGAG